MKVLKTMKVLKIIKAVIALATVVCMGACIYENDIQNATFLAVLYLIIK